MPTQSARQVAGGGMQPFVNQRRTLLRCSNQSSQAETGNGFGLLRFMLAGSTPPATPRLLPNAELCRLGIKYCA
jgi:hypothetical protein